MMVVVLFPLYLLMLTIDSGFSGAAFCRNLAIFLTIEYGASLCLIMLAYLFEKLMFQILVSSVTFISAVVTFAVYLSSSGCSINSYSSFAFCILTVRMFLHIFACLWLKIIGVAATSEFRLASSRQHASSLNQAVSADQSADEAHVLLLSQIQYSHLLATGCLHNENDLVIVSNPAINSQLDASLNTINADVPDPLHLAKEQQIHQANAMKQALEYIHDTLLEDENGRYQFIVALNQRLNESGASQFTPENNYNRDTGNDATSNQIQTTTRNENITFLQHGNWIVRRYGQLMVHQPGGGLLVVDQPIEVAEQRSEIISDNPYIPAVVRAPATYIHGWSTVTLRLPPESGLNHLALTAPAALTQLQITQLDDHIVAMPNIRKEHCTSTIVEERADAAGLCPSSVNQNTNFLTFDEMKKHRQPIEYCPNRCLPSHSPTFCVAEDQVNTADQNEVVAAFTAEKQNNLRRKVQPANMLYSMENIANDELTLLSTALPPDHCDTRRCENPNLQSFDGALNSGACLGKISIDTECLSKNNELKCLPNNMLRRAQRSMSISMESRCFRTSAPYFQPPEVSIIQNDSPVTLVLPSSDNSAPNMCDVDRSVSANCQRSQLSVNSEFYGCNICLEEYKEGDHVKHLPCLHQYHSMCIDRSLILRNACPICRLPVFCYIPTVFVQ